LYNNYMCGRYTLELNNRFERRFHIIEPMPKMQSRYNIAPGQELPVIVNNQIKVMKWGLVPFWSKDGKDQIINVRSETIGIKPMFKNLLKFSRCLVPATGFFEWKRKEKEKIPYFFRLKSHDYFSFAGIYDKNTYAVLTTTPNELMSSVHNRMPVILQLSDEDNWMKNEKGLSMINELFKPYDSSLMECVPISSRANSPINDDKEILKPGLIN